MQELLDKRTRNSKTFSLGGRRYAWDGQIGAKHYKEDERGLAGPWVDIDTTIRNGKVRAAPYDLDIRTNGLPGFWYKSKHSGEFNIALEQAMGRKPRRSDPIIEGNRAIWKDVFPDFDMVLVAGTCGAKLFGILKTPNAPFEHEMLIEKHAGRAILQAIRPAMDAAGQELGMEEILTPRGRIERLVRIEHKIAYPITDATTVSEQVGAQDDDAFERGDGSFDTAATLVLLQAYTDTGHRDYACVGARFQTVNVPQGATIENGAYLEVEVWHTSYDDPNLVIYGNDTDSADDFSTEADIIDTRVRTTESASWVATGVGTGWYGSAIEIKTIIKEIVDRGSWAANNHMAFMWIANTDGSEKLYFYSYDEGDNTHGPKLWFQYTAVTVDLSYSCVV